MQRLVGALAREPQSAKRMPQRAPAFRAQPQQSQRMAPIPSQPMQQPEDMQYEAPENGMGQMPQVPFQPLPNRQYTSAQFDPRQYQPQPNSMPSPSPWGQQPAPTQMPPRSGFNMSQPSAPMPQPRFQYQPYRKPQGM